jgi:molecular chaperone GrpE
MQDDELTIEADGSEELGAEGKGVKDKLGKMKEDLERARKEKQEYLDGWQRAKADYVNALKRFDEEKGAAVGMGVVRSARAFLPAMDSLARAEAAGEIPEAFAGIARQLHEGAKSLGLEQFGTTGEQFDPTMHEALGQDPVSSAREDDTVTAVLEHGWRAGGVVVRPAKVRVGHFEG